MKNYFVTFLLLGILFSVSAQTDSCLVNLQLGLSFPPVAVDSQRTFTQTHLNTLGMDRIRFGENWALREPTQGNFNWTGLDERIAWADANNIEIILSIQSEGPAWACSAVQNSKSCVYNDNNEFKTYIDSVLLRYPNQIDKIQFGNEWVETFWYAGNAQDFIDANNVVYNSVQTLSPSTQVVLGGFTTMSLRISAGCNGAVQSVKDDLGTVLDQTWFTANCNTAPFLAVKARVDSVLNYALYDLIDLHLYDDVEQWDEYFYDFTDTITTPIIVTEFGGPNINYEPSTQSYQADRVYQYIKKLDSLQITEAYFFKLIEGGGANPTHITSGLVDSTNLAEKECYWVFNAFSACPMNLAENKSGISIHPNPAQNIIQLTLENQTSFKVRIYSLNGQLISTHINQTSINVSNLNCGTYLLTVEGSDGTLARELIVIQ